MNLPFPVSLDASFIVGRVAETSARVLARAPGGGVLEVADRRIPLTVDPSADHTALVELEGLTPDTTYPVLLNGVTGALRTMPLATDRLCFAFVSCHMPFVECAGSIQVESSVRMLDALSSVIQARDVRFVLHVGDQVYTDVDRLPSLNIWNYAAAHPEADKRALYHALYRGYFGVPELARIHRFVSNMMIWDDGDIHDVFGSIPFTRDDTGAMFVAARSAYIDYQHRLNPNPAGPPSRALHYAFEAGPASFFVLDLRGHRDHRTHTLLGAEQWAEFEAWIAATEHRQHRFVISSVPLLHTPDVLVERLTRLGTVVGDALPPAFHDRWSAAAFHAELERMLGILLPRGITVLAGDIHIGTANDIHDHEGRRIHQWVSSAITHRASLGNRLKAEIVSRLANLATPWPVTSRFHELRNNFGVVEITPRGTSFELYVDAGNGCKPLYRVDTP